MSDLPRTTPDDVRFWLYDGPFPVGEARAVAVLGVNRTTLHRWLSGAVRAPHAAALVLRHMAEGIPPTGTDDWRGFQWDGDALVTPTGERLTARQIDGLHWERQHKKALEREVQRLRAEVEALRRVGGSANDATVSPPHRVTSWP